MQLFPGMMDMIDCHDSEKFAEVLKGSLKQLVKEKSEDSPEHNFLIGLAYLSGIDMERDPDMALTLITDAADAGLLEAMDKLGVMYLKGQGVAVDYKEALKWFSRAAEKGYSWSMYHMGKCIMTEKVSPGLMIPRVCCFPKQPDRETGRQCMK